MWSSVDDENQNKGTETSTPSTRSSGVWLSSGPVTVRAPQLNVRPAQTPTFTQVFEHQQIPDAGPSASRSGSRQGLCPKLNSARENDEKPPRNGGRENATAKIPTAKTSP